MKKIWQSIIKYKLYLFLLIPIIYVVYYLNTCSLAMVEVKSFLTTTDQVEVANDKWIKFTPEISNGKGVIFYPGGKVDPESYAPLMYHLTENGYTCYLIKMPFNLAVFKSNAAQAVILSDTEIKHWFIGGHSLGGAMASQYVNKNPDAVEGIFFLAAYPVESTSLVDFSIKSLSMYGEKDGLIPLSEIKVHEKLLPSKHIIQIIKGANHGQFGYYGIQKNDQKSDISREEQQKQVLDALLKWMQN